MPGSGVGRWSVPGGRGGVLGRAGRAGVAGRGQALGKAATARAACDGVGSWRCGRTGGSLTCCGRRPAWRGAATTPQCRVRVPVEWMGRMAVGQPLGADHFFSRLVLSSFSVSAELLPRFGRSGNRGNRGAGRRRRIRNGGRRKTRDTARSVASEAPGCLRRAPIAELLAPRVVLTRLNCGGAA